MGRHLISSKHTEQHQEKHALPAGMERENINLQKPAKYGGYLHFWNTHLQLPRAWLFFFIQYTIWKLNYIQFNIYPNIKYVIIYSWCLKTSFIKYNKTQQCTPVIPVSQLYLSCFIGLTFAIKVKTSNTYKFHLKPYTFTLHIFLIAPSISWSLFTRYPMLQRKHHTWSSV